MCADEAGIKGSGCVKGVGVALLIWSILELDIFGIILASIVVCSCCGPAHQMKTCLIIFTAIFLLLELGGLAACVGIGAQWLAGADKCEDSMRCVVASSCDATYGTTGQDSCEAAKGSSSSSRMLEASPEGTMDAQVDATPMFKLFASYGHRILFPVSTSLIYGLPSPSMFTAQPTQPTTQGRALSESCSFLCLDSYLGDGQCDLFCDNEACNYDNNDCPRNSNNIVSGSKCCAFETTGSDAGPHCWSTTSSSPKDICLFFRLIGNVILAIGLITCLISTLLMGLLLCGLCKLEGGSPKA